MRRSRGDGETLTEPPRAFFQKQRLCFCRAVASPGSFPGRLALTATADPLAQDALAHIWRVSTENSQTRPCAPDRPRRAARAPRRRLRLRLRLRAHRRRGAAHLPPSATVDNVHLRAPKSLWVIRSEHCRIGTIGATCRRFASRLAYYLPVARWSPSPSAAFLHSNLPCFVCPNSLSPSTG
jgi:hypothetical protein